MDRFTNLEILAHEADHEYNETLTLFRLPIGDLVLIYTFEDEQPEAQLWPLRDRAMAWDSFLRRAEAMREESR